MFVHFNGFLYCLLICWIPWAPECNISIEHIGFCFDFLDSLGSWIQYFYNTICFLLLFWSLTCEFQVFSLDSSALLKFQPLCPPSLLKRKQFAVQFIFTYNIYTFWRLFLLFCLLTYSPGSRVVPTSAFICRLLFE